ncbi:MAG TPA: ABC transporter substrate-binding protein [Gaiellaceae bacterium]|jgi:putative spermidine/putrescine transport system substrate-binding protein
MEDWEAQEVEFWAKLEEEGMSRSAMLRRSAAAALGLTIVGSASTALAATKAKLAGPTHMTKDAFGALVAAAKKEGHLNTIALPPDWANYGEELHTFPRKYGIGITNDNPDGSSAQENEAVRSLKGDKRAPDAVDVSVSFAIAGANEGLYAKYFNLNYKTIPRALKDTRGYWMGDYWGAVSIGYNKTLVSNPPKTIKDLLKPEYKGKVAINGSPLSSGSAIGAVFASALANGGSLNDVGPGIDFWAQMKKSGNYIPVQTTAQTVASGQTPISLDWDYNNLAYVSEFPAANWGYTVPQDGVYGAYYAQAINASAPHPNAARLWEEFLYSDQGQIIWLKSGAHPARFNDLVARKVIPKAVLAKLPAASIYTKVKFASLGQQTKAKALIAQQWPTKVG